MNHFSISAGGILFYNHSVLLEKIDYGANRGMWMVPGGFAEPGESIEEAAEREFKEETGLVTKSGRVVCLRSGTQERNGEIQRSLYIVFEMNFVSGSLIKDEAEIADMKYWNIEEVKNSNEIIELSKSIITTAWESKNGLYAGDKVRTNNSYRSYHYYLPN
ncbi:ADP-ribose pyrophosphatase YjhB (NUDIX family) [Paenibacillus rhizosphaerae]|uniref:ADP-ribose pyrophosphatase YjhB (NUDIX family) n=1 Tax=Paenibacillus rhizosphaerae TaxID=297318 RepID=A0A839TSJ0_9BACL|nr:NUDIX hydrolase [Paenibacillus rhizosphaerae]MBB3129511.1 ADP-ribose pyrophosphatase YjhB (NUDIX family) [Paenibacillus rhizosphaerae]